MSVAAERQIDSLRSFLTLCSLRDSWSGALLLGIGLDAGGRALALASLAAGAAGLFLEGDRQLLRAAQREGCCSFSVSTLEEAIRALKNEIRQGKAIAIALAGDTASRLAEISARGLQPQAVAFTREPQSSESASCKTLVERGSIPLRDSGLPLIANLGGQCDAVDYRFAVDSASTMAERRLRDSDLMPVSNEPGLEADRARRWLRAAPSLFPRALERAYPVFGPGH